MIFFNFQIDNPFKTTHFSQKNYIVIDKLIAKNKAFSMQFTRWQPHTLFQVKIDLAVKGQDHAGPNLTIEFFGFFFDIKIYDTRHWDYEKGTWEVYDETHDSGN